MSRIVESIAEYTKNAHEIELKFALSADDAEKITTRPPWLSVSSAKIRKLHSIYYDTPDRALRHNGLSLRIRDDEGKRVQTLKTLEQGDVAFGERGEWSWAVAGYEPELAGKGANILPQAVLQVIRQTPLEPVFVIDVVRRCFEVVHEEARIEVSIDSGVVTAEGQHDSFQELELELMEGDKAALFSFAREIFRHVPLHLHQMAKSERGYELLHGRGTKSFKAEKLSLAPGMLVKEAFQRIARAGLRHLLANESVFRKTQSAESVHQVRVALRRLRAAMVVFRRIVRDDISKRLKAELRWAAGELASARALDVYISDILNVEVPDPAVAHDYTALREEYDQSRERAYASAAAILNSRRFSYALLVLAQWIECGSWLSSECGRETVLSGYAARQLGRRWKKVRRDAAHRASFSDKARHAWRIEVKKLRYACEFFASLYLFADEDGGKEESPPLRAMRCLSDLQDHLGALNDISEARGRNPLSDAARHLYRKHRKERAGLLQKIDAEYTALAKIMPFWKTGGGSA